MKEHMYNWYMAETGKKKLQNFKRECHLQKIRSGKTSRRYQKNMMMHFAKLEKKCQIRKWNNKRAKLA